ncbi:amino acid ABC transporter ATP-binding protein [Furfurilactobacillus siliginis]|uniref:ABC-type polar amino acid transport system, ATPase component n=1 Tax=Furfurilactobacillus siliginis TaxID=348151 RepID=A0A0R2L9P6_9LACO|nr:amino acid ABC transporter ATP-binding protein [Furfurilactobacillus siliginis]KRN95469.1 ABC-type polar amino acid transport system, ATPase component [Furfurilactobacillus siliginis]GEK28242.1 polar amino acid ABC transporter ATP-binding protein [Furfurilactobacillus siliginis]
MFEMKGINKTFAGRQILKDFSMTVPDNEIISIVGPSGAGKTTLLRCIAGLETPDAGTFLLNGQAFNPVEDHGRERKIGVVFQDFNLFPNLSVEENITLAPTLVTGQKPVEARQAVSELMASLGLAQVAKQYPYQLSGGQKQRVAIARALAMQPEILCYDEPTSALDPTLRDTVGQLILELKQRGITQIVVTHDQDFAQNIADQVVTVSPLGA